MELKIIEKKEKPLLLRTEIIAEILFKGKTPSKEEIKKGIVKEVKTNEDLVIIKKIRTYFGLGKVNITAYIYSNKSDVEKTEPKKKERKKAEVKKEEKEEKAGKKKKEVEEKKEKGKEEAKEGKEKT